MRIKKYKRDEQEIKETRLALVALIGICTVALIQILGLTNRDVEINIALYCFAIAIPFLAIFLYALVVESSYESTVKPWYMQVMLLVGTVGAIIGITCLFGHFSWLIGITFLICGVAGIVGVAAFSLELEKQNKDEQNKKER